MNPFSGFGVYFAHPENSVFLLGVPAIFVLMVASARVRERMRRQLALDSFEKTFKQPVNRRLKSALFILGYFFTALAAMGPQWGQKAHTVKAQGLDICFALDLSRSMLAEDQSPSRLAVAKNQLTIFLPRLGGDRAALVGFAGTAFIAAPLTPDYTAATGFLEPLDPSFVSNQSTDLGSGVEACLKALGLAETTDRNEIMDSAAKIIVLVSDGEDQFEDTKKAVDKAEKLGVPIFAMAVGTTKGGPVPSRDERGELRSYLKDPKTNQPVLTKLEEAGLKKITDKTGGKVFYLTDGVEAWNGFNTAIESYKRDSRDAGTRLDREDRFQFPLLAAVLILLLEFLIPETAWRKERTE